MTDRELLELAAKAAGFQLDELSGRVIRRESDGQPVYWNPLTDDGDALRLLLKLMRKTVNMSLAFDAVSIAQVFSSTKATLLAVEDASNDPYAATRRAIVRAAAEIGRAMP